MFFLLGIFISIFLLLLLVIKKNKSSADKLLAVWLFMIIINQVLNYFLVNGGIYQYPHWLGVEFSLPIIYYAVWGAIFGIALTYLGKSWYLDRMVWLYEDMKSESEAYSKWEY